MIAQTVSPIDGRIYVERELADAPALDRVLARSREAQHDWRHASLAERAAVCDRFVDAFCGERDAIAEELTWQMGRPLRHTPGEVGGVAERARAMTALAADALAQIDVSDQIDVSADRGLRRFIRREPLGVVLTIAPWNYPYLTAVNSVVPAIMAGNAVVLRHSAQTPLCAERFGEAFDRAGLPAGVFQAVHTSHELAQQLVTGMATGAAGVDYVAFTGSVEAGRAVARSVGERFIGAGLELGGKDPAYVRADADLERAVDGLVDGAFFNAGQSCCGIERIYVHRDLFSRFVEAYVERVRAYRLGDPLDPDTTLGPVIRPTAADFVRGQVAEAVAAGAKALVDPAAFPADHPGTGYLAPQVLVDVDHGMRVMREESFGPVVGIAPVASDDEAVALMNDSEFGLTASVWTADEEAALRIGERVETGTWFMNRCDYLDPTLAWTGVKNSGRGCTLSRVGYETLTRPKSFHLRA